jgi:spermidine synthase
VSRGEGFAGVPSLSARAGLLLMVASGFAGLGYQIVWTQQVALWLGHESAAVLAVVAAFFGGLGVGALGLGARIERSTRPLRWYLWCELSIAAWGLVVVGLAGPFGRSMLDLMGEQPGAVRQWAVAFCGSFVLLLPATAAMGATLPAMARVLAASRGGLHSIAGLYAANTLGAVVGVLTTAFWFVPAFGLTRTSGLCIALNLLCAALAWRAQARQGGPTMAMALPTVSPPAAPGPPTARRRALGLLAMTGLLGIGYEVLVVRVLSQVSENTVYTFAMLLAVYLFGTTAGAALYARWGLRSTAPAVLGDRLLAVLAAACLVGSAGLWGAEAIKARWLVAAGGGVIGSLGAEAALAVLAFGLPTMAMGALFSHLSTRASAAGIGFGRSLGVNTLGAAAAPSLFGVLLAPAIGAKWVLLVVVAGYLALMQRRSWASPVAWVPAGLAVLLGVAAPHLAFVEVPEGGRVVSYEEGVAAAVSVVEDSAGVARLRIDNRQQEGSSASRFVDARQALLPVLLHPAPRRAMFLGLGTGVTASSAALDQSLQVDAIELLPEVISASRHFTQAFDGGEPNRRVHLVHADARRYVRTTTQRYDVIVSDNFHPARQGSGALYTTEHFAAVRERLTHDGIFCQWLPLHQLDLVSLRSIVRSFLQAYPEGAMLLASNSLETPVIGLLGRREAGRLPLPGVRARLANARLASPAAGFGIEDEFALLGGFVAGPGALRTFAGNARPNTDDLPVVAYRAPWLTYSPESTPRDRLLALLNELTVAPAEVFDVDAADPWAKRMAAYWVARDLFIDAGRNVRPTNDAAAMLAQVQAPLLRVVGTSPDFRPAYDPLVRMAVALGRRDQAAGRALLTELVRLQPARTEAVQALAASASAPGK